jgi:hypothetical protein
MVHHGYTRPGYGYITGDCGGVDQLPYEVSCEALKGYKTALENHVAEKEAYLAKLQAGEITHLMDIRRDFDGRTVKTEYVAGVTEPFCWMRVVESRIANTKSTIHYIKTDIERCEKRIAAWEPKPVRTVEEETAKEDAAKAERKAVKEAARAAREAKKAATQKKQAELAARRQVMKDELVVEFKALAEQEKSAARDTAVQKLCEKVNSAKYRWLWVHELGIPETLIQLGLLERTQFGNQYKWPLVRA